MTKKLIVPELPNMTEGILVFWEKGVGDKVEQGDVIYEIETDKVVNQIEAELEGTITKILIKEGETVQPGTVVAELE